MSGHGHIIPPQSEGDVLMDHLRALLLGGDKLQESCQLCCKIVARIRTEPAPPAVSAVTQHDQQERI